jgi:hypothetical protein
VRANDYGLGSIIVHIGQELPEASLVLDFRTYGGNAIDLRCVDSLPGPWYREDGASAAVGQDIWGRLLSSPEIPRES